MFVYVMTKHSKHSPISHTFGCIGFCFALRSLKKRDAENKMVTQKMAAIKYFVTMYEKEAKKHRDNLWFPCWEPSLAAAKWCILHIRTSFMNVAKYSLLRLRERKSERDQIHLVAFCQKWRSIVMLFIDLWTITQFKFMQTSACIAKWSSCYSNYYCIVVL